MLIFAVTGLGIHWEKDAGRLVNRWLGRPEAIMVKPVPPTQGAVPLSVGQIEKIALTALLSAPTMIGVFMLPCIPVT